MIFETLICSLHLKLTVILHNCNVIRQYSVCYIILSHIYPLILCFLRVETRACSGDQIIRMNDVGKEKKILRAGV